MNRILQIIVAAVLLMAPLAYGMAQMHCCAS